MSIAAVSVRSTSPVVPAGSPGASTLPSDARVSLLPEPPAGALAGSDPLSVMYLFESKDRNDELSTGTSRVRGLQTERAQELQKELAAIQQEDDAVKHKSFWDSLGSVLGEVAKVAAVVASVAAAVCTCGAAAPLAALAIAGAVLSTAAFVDGECHVLKALGVDDKTAGWIDLGMSIGGALCSGGAALASSAQAAASSTATAANSATSSTVATIKTTATVVTGVTAVAGGVATIESGQAQAAIDRADADQIVAEALSDHYLRNIQTVIDEVQDSDEKSKQILKTIVATKGIQNDTAAIAAGSIKG
jgi:hypothetical protein